MATMNQALTDNGFGNIDQANENYVKGLIAKAKTGVKLSPEELSALLDYKTQQNREIEIRDLIARAKSGDTLQPQELQKLQDYKNGVAPELSQSSSIPKQYQEGVQAVATSNSRFQTGQDKLFSKQLAKIGPIANVQIGDIPGDTPLVRLANKIYGIDNWQIDAQNNLTVKGKGQKDFHSLPLEDIIPSLQRAGTTIATSTFGEAIGSLGGIPGIAAGGAVGGAAGEHINIRNSINDAEKLGLIKSEEKKAFDETLTTGTVIGGVSGGVFGGGLPVLTGTAKGLAKGGLKAVPGAIRVEDQSLAQAGSDALRRFGLSSPNLQKSKAALRSEALSDAMMTEFRNVDPGTAGRISRQSMENFINETNTESDILFEKAKQNTLTSLQKGKPVALYDISGLWNDFKNKTLSLTSDNNKASVNSFLNALEAELNFTKRAVSRGDLTAQGAAKRQFMMAQPSVKPLDTTVFGPGQSSIGVRQSLSEEFNPGMVTAFDFNKTKNFIKDELTSVDNPKFILDKESKKNITQFLKALERPFSGVAEGAGDEASQIAATLGIDSKELIKNPYLSSQVKAPINSSDFKDVTKGYQVRQEGFKILSPETRKLLKEPSDTALQDKLVNLDSTLAGQVKNIVNNYAPIEEQQLFTTSVKSSLLKPQGGAGTKSLQRKSLPGVRPETLQQAAIGEDELRALQAQGIKPTKSAIDQQMVSQSQLPGSPEDIFLTGSYGSKKLTDNSLAQQLLGPDEYQKSLAQSKQLAGLQETAGIPQSNAAAGGFSRVPASIANPQTPTNLISLLMNAGISGARPLSRGAADLLEMTRNLAPTATFSNLGGYATRNPTIFSNQQ